MKRFIFSKKVKKNDILLGAQGKSQIIMILKFHRNCANNKTKPNQVQVNVIPPKAFQLRKLSIPCLSCQAQALNVL